MPGPEGPLPLGVRGEQSPREKKLGDLDGVQRCALAERP
jgi:hypothetical protein